ncbi:MAG: sigma-70 family RNA polymerase sigma factor [Aequorivita sp.]|nr:sigma-70 family RNA polymerase sigma factor [Aequorivita sp.]
MNKTSENNIAFFVANNSIKLSNKKIDKMFEERIENENNIARTHLPLVLAIANSFNYTTGVSFDEIFSAGLLGLTYAIQTYKPTHSEKYQATFTTYAKICITNKIIEFKNVDEIIKPPKCNRNNNVVPTTYKFSDLLRDNNDGDEPTMEERIANEFEDDYQENEINNELELIQIIKQEVKKEKQQDIIIKYFGLMCEAKNYRELAKEYNTSYQNIGSTFNKVINKLKKNERFKMKLKQLYNN